MIKKLISLFKIIYYPKMEYYTIAMFSFDDETEKRSRKIYFPLRYKDMEPVIANDRYFKRILKKAAKVSKTNKKFINHPY